MGHLERRVIDQNVDTPELFDCLFDDVVAVLFLRQVPWQQQALSARCLNPARCFLRVFMLIEVGDGNVGSFAGVGDGYRPADTAVRSSDKCNFAFQSVLTGIRLLSAVWIRLHLPLRTGDVLRLGKGGVGKSRTVVAPAVENVNTGLKRLALVLLVSICIRYDERCGVHYPMSYVQCSGTTCFARKSKM